jgi:hypothetical protein
MKFESTQILNEIPTMFIETQTVSHSQAKGVANLELNDQYLYTMDQTENSERLMQLNRVLGPGTPKLHLEVRRTSLHLGT